VMPVAAGEARSWIAMFLRKLSRIREMRGDYAGALSLAEEAVATARAYLEEDSPRFAGVLAGLAAGLANVGDITESLDLALQADALIQEGRRVQAQCLPEIDALREVGTTGGGAIELAVSLVVSAGTPSAGDVRRVWDAVVRSRALVLDQIASRNLAISRSTDPEIAGLVRDLQDASARVGTLMVRGPRAGQKREDFRASLKQARRDLGRAEEVLALRSAPFDRIHGRSRAGLDEALGGLPPGSALVAVKVYRKRAIPPPAAVPGTGASEPIVKEPFDRLSYAAFVLPPGGRESVVVDLGPAGEIEEAVDRWREAARRPPPSPKEGGEAEVAGDALRRMLWDPLKPHIEGAARIFIVPDGALHTVSFAALPAAGGRYLVETAPAVHYLSSERDLMAAPVGPRGKGLLAVGDAAFDGGPAVAEARTGDGGDARDEAAPIRSFGGKHSACASFEELRFEPLPASGSEVAEIASVWPKTEKVLKLTGPAASEEAFKAQAPGHRILHLATHGFFLGGRCDSALDGERGLGLVEIAAPSEEPPLEGENPLLLSGLVLAGANNRDHAGAEEDGILTAQEIAAMDLSGVEWAVLSACETGVGEIRAGEGVFGLRRAFQVAGADTLIMSLWSVEDEAARAWMKALYEGRLIQDLDTAEAVRHASLTVLKDRREQGLSDHPFYWAGFVAAGDWR